jgi:RecA/RadA recombinase
MNKKFDLSDYVKKDEVEETVYKPLQYVVMPECFQKVTSLPGIALGHSTMIYGLSDSGKTDIMLKVAKEAVSQDILPFLIITENKLDIDRLKSYGLKHGENCIVEEKLTTLEEVYDYISMKVEDIKKNRLKQNCIILWDSWAGTHAKDTMEIDKEGRIIKKHSVMKNAQVGGQYNSIVMKRIASTREMDCNFSLGLLMLNQAYLSPSTMPGIPPSTVANGGNKIWYPLSLSLLIKEGKRIKTTINGQDYKIGLISKIKVEKNHITGVYTEGEVVLAGSEMFENDEKLIKAYKESYKEKS